MANAVFLCSDVGIKITLRRNSTVTASPDIRRTPVAVQHGVFLDAILNTHDCRGGNERQNQSDAGIARGRVNLKSFNTLRFPLFRIQQAFDTLRDRFGEAQKVLVELQNWNPAK